LAGVNGIVAVNTHNVQRLLNLLVQAFSHKKSNVIVNLSTLRAKMFAKPLDRYPKEGGGAALRALFTASE